MPEDYVDLLAAAGDRGVSIHFLFSGCDALNFARHWQMGLWIANSRLCDMSGFELAGKLRSQRPNATIFIIGDEYQLADELETMTLGLAKYLCKPLEPAWVLPDRDASCIPLSALRDAGAPRRRKVRGAQLAGRQTCPETAACSPERTPLDRAILPFGENCRPRPAA
jgi:CheY-like chemotaxis protein